MLKKILFPLTILFLLPCGVGAQQSADEATWRKEYEKRIADTIAWRKKQKAENPEDLYFSKPDFVVFRPAVEPEKLGDCYNDHFQVFDGCHGRMFALTCQATCEGALDQHVTLFHSDDQGKTWSKPRVLAGPQTMTDDVPIASWGFPLVSRSGRIYILYNQYVPGKVSTLRQHTGIMAGIYSDDNGQTWSQPQEVPIPRTSNDSPDTTIPPEWVVWQKPLRLAEGGKYLVGVTRYVAPQFHSKYRTVTEFIRFNNVDDDPQPRDLRLDWMMTGDKVLHVGVHCEEPGIVKLPDGRLFALLRTGMGHPYWSVSSDGGENWTPPEKLLDKDGGKPFLHPVSPCPLYDWKGNEAGSGYYFALIHNRFDFNNKNPWQNRGPLYLIAGKFQPGAKQPIWFTAEPKLFLSRPHNNSFYTSTTQVNGETVLWYNDQKFYLLGKKIGPEWFEGVEID
ncbi:MAG: sialidase family protein [Planctomycetia bacterium]|nr:sialidase family protein [Planctomycetia bacterium]